MNICDKTHCKVRGSYVYCQLEKGRWAYTNCMFYGTPTSDPEPISFRQFKGLEEAELSDLVIDKIRRSRL